VQQPPSAAAGCVPVAGWVRPADGAVVATPELFAQLAGAGIVLAGESHDRADHHVWQAEILAGLLARRDKVAVGVEMLPRRAQKALDRWVAGESSEAEFLAESDWRHAWGFDFALYRPVFLLARLNRVRMVALNVDRTLVAKVGREGWDAVPEGEREGVGRATPPDPAYLDSLARIYGEHRRPGATGAIDRDAPGFRRFVEAQTLWDRAMAEGLAAARRDGAAVVLGLVGRGHVEDGFGVPRQLAALGEPVAALLPWEADEECARLRPGLADAVFGMAPPEPAPLPQRLGIAVEPAEAASR
jgi:uncharacterized iron-regulated protein